MGRIAHICSPVEQPDTLFLEEMVFEID
jgi:hypothetical protein